jgi:lycopene cyclase domain-containing protein
MSTYLLINLFSVAVPLICSFHKRLQIYRTWYALWPAILITASFFIVWDIYFTRWGVWGFNAKHLLGIEWLGLPVEEWLFFVCIPYACVFTYACLKRLLKQDYLGRYAARISWALVVLLTAIGLWQPERLYTNTTFLATAIFLVLHLLVLKSSYLGRFYFAWLILIFPFLVVNGLLTGSLIEEQVVWYNDAENLGLRLLTIPMEDIIYGLLLILMNVTIYEGLISWRKKAERNSHSQRSKPISHERVNL